MVDILPKTGMMNESLPNLIDRDTLKPNFFTIATPYILQRNIIPTPFTDKFYQDNYDKTDVKVLRNFIKEITNESLGVGLTYFGKTKFDVAINKLNELIINIVDPKFNIPIVTSIDETVNGYKLYNSKTNIMTYDTFIELTKLMESKKKYTFSEMKNKMSNTCCTDWYKMDDTGKPYGGFWCAPEGSYQNKNAWDLSFAKSCKKMWKLPFSDDLLLKTIDMGCTNRMESVRYSNFICVWLERKMEQMKKD